MALPASPNNGDIAFLDNNTYQYDSSKNRWTIYSSARESRIEDKFDSEIANFKVRNLADVVIPYAPEEGTVLGWDSDVGSWAARQFTFNPLGAIAVKSQVFTATQGQTEFRLAHYPLGNITIVRNGFVLSPLCISAVGKDATYDASQNENSGLDAGDKVVISYNYGTTAALTTDLNNLDDVDLQTSAPVNGDVLAWDSDSSTFKPSDRLTAAEEDIAQAVSDRIYTDSVLAARIDDLDSDVASQTGNFYVQATAPEGTANSGWVNTSDLKLYIWDVTNEVWIQTTLT